MGGATRVEAINVEKRMALARTCKIVILLAGAVGSSLTIYFYPVPLPLRRRTRGCLLE